MLDDVENSDACFRTLWDHFSHPAAWRCLPGVEPVMTELKRGGLTVGLASNFDRRLRTVVAGLPSLAAIGPAIISAEVGWRKPAAEFYEALVRALGCRRDEVLLVGDDFQNDFAGATGAGLRAVLLDAASRADVASIPRLSDLCRHAPKCAERVARTLR